MPLDILIDEIGRDYGFLQPVNELFANFDKWSEIDSAIFEGQSLGENSLLMAR